MPSAAGLAGEFRVEAGHDAHQRRLAGAVDADDPILAPDKSSTRCLSALLPPG
jgi:hypothetical protein